MTLRLMWSCFAREHKEEWTVVWPPAAPDWVICPHGLFKCSSEGRWSCYRPASTELTIYPPPLHREASAKEKESQKNFDCRFFYGASLNCCWIRKWYESLVVCQKTNPNWAAVGENNFLHLHDPTTNRNSENRFW